MAIGLKIDVHGVRETLAELYKYERDVYKTITDDLKLSAKPAADAVGREFPDKPLDNWHETGGRKGNSRMPAYSGISAKSGVSVVVSTRKPRGNNTHGLIRLQQKDAGGQVYDTAGSALKGGGSSAGQRFVSNLDKHSTTKSRTGRYRSRVMYPATKKNLPLIEKAVEVSVRKVDAEVTKRLNG
jgi:hypothetical protein